MTMIPNSSTKTFVQIFDNYNTFETSYKASALKNAIKDTNLEILYYLLYARYGNNPISNFDENQWKYKVFGVIYQYGPTWEKKSDIQATLRGLTEDQIKKGMARAVSNTGTASVNGSETYNNLTSTDSGADVHNHAYNPATEPSTQTTNQLNYIDEQNVDKFGKTNTMNGSVSNTNSQTSNASTSDEITKGILDGYAELWDLLVSDVTEDFLAKFKPLFKKFVSPFTELYEGED